MFCIFRFFLYLCIMNYEEIKTVLLELFANISDIGDYFRDEEYADVAINEELLLEKVGKHVTVSCTPTYDGHDCSAVMHFVEHNVYIQISGYYSSYDGINWSKLGEVFPYQKTITCYSDKKTAK